MFLLLTQAKESFEASAKKFMVETIKFAKNQRPQAKWGYHNQPKCLNYRPSNHMKPACPEIVKKENDRLNISVFLQKF